MEKPKDCLKINHIRVSKDAKSAVKRLIQNSLDKEIEKALLLFTGMNFNNKQDFFESLVLSIMKQNFYGYGRIELHNGSPQKYYKDLMDPVIKKMIHEAEFYLACKIKLDQIMVEIYWANGSSWIKDTLNSWIDYLRKGIKSEKFYKILLEVSYKSRRRL